MKLLRFMLVCAFALMTLSLSALADPVLVGGTTQVTLTSAPTLTSLGLTVSPTGTATVLTNASGLPVASFGITGNTPANLIFHDGSGLRLAAGAASISIGDFLIDTSKNLITGTVSVNGTLVGNGISIFNIGSGLSLTLAAPALSAIGSTFSLNATTVNALSTAVIGTANIVPAAAVPEPATMLMLLTGASMAAPAIRRRLKKRHDTAV